MSIQFLAGTSTSDSILLKSTVVRATSMSYIPVVGGSTQGALRGIDCFKGLNAFDLLRLGAAGVVKLPAQLHIDPKIK